MTDTDFFNLSSMESMITTPLSIGQIDLHEVYVFYDQPLLFLVQSQSKGNPMYIGNAIDETDDDETWMYLEVSQQRLNQINNKEIDLYTAYKQSENDLLIKFTIHNKLSRETGTLHATEELVEADSMPDELLPVPGYYLNE